MSRVAILTGEVVGPRLAGPAIRALAMAEALANDHDVTVLAASVDGAADRGFAVEALSDATCARAAASDVLIVQGDLLDRYPALVASDACVVADLYDPYHLEALEQSAHLAPDRRRATIAASVGAIVATRRCCGAWNPASVPTTSCSGGAAASTRGSIRRR